MKPQYFVIVGLMFAALFLVACSDDVSTSGELPPLESTAAPGPVATPTFIPLAVSDEITAPDWTNVEYMRAAMRPEHADEIYDFVDLTRYYIEAELDYGVEAGVISGQQIVRYVNNTTVEQEEVVFRLTPNIGRYGLQLRVQNVKLDGSPVDVTYEARGSVMSVPLSPSLPIGESVEITMDFIFVAETGVLGTATSFGLGKNQFKMINWMPVVSVYDGPELGWFRDRIYGNDWDPYYGEMALWEIKLTHDAALPLAISGISIEDTDNGDGTITQHIVTGPVRDNYVIAGPEFGVITDVTEGITVNVYFMPGGERGAEWVMETSLRSLELFNRVFGEYPYSTLDVIQVQTTAGVGGVEYSNLILIDSDIWENGSPVAESVTVHEVAHQWWYLLVGNNQTRAPYMDEAMASFSEGVYWREAYDDNGERYSNWILGAQNQVNNIRFAVNDTSMYQEPNEVEPQWAAAALYYAQGRVFYNTLEQALRTPAVRIGEYYTDNGMSTTTAPIDVQNDVTFTRQYNRDLYEVDKAEMTYRALQHYFDKMKYEISEPADVLQSYEAVTGQELDQIFYDFFGVFPGLDTSNLEGFESDGLRTDFVGG